MSELLFCKAIVKQRFNDLTRMFFQENNENPVCGLINRSTVENRCQGVGISYLILHSKLELSQCKANHLPISCDR